MNGSVFRRLLLRAPRRNQADFVRNAFWRSYAESAPGPRQSLQTSQSRIERFNRRLPKFLHRYTNALASAPLSHITSFLILHELTAVIPLFGLVGVFHYTHWLPTWFAEGAWVLKGVEMFGRYFRRKGWIRSGEAEEAEREVSAELEKDKESKQLRKIDRAWSIGEGGTRLVVEFATAYAITKMLLPLRIMMSVWGTPWFASRTVVPVMRRMRTWFGRKKVKPTGSAAGTGAVEGGAVSKSAAGSGKGKDI